MLYWQQYDIEVYVWCILYVINIYHLTNPTNITPISQVFPNRDFLQKIIQKKNKK